MSSIKIAVIVGSLRQASINRKLAQAIATLGAAQAQFEFVEIGNLPLYNEEADGQEVAAVTQFRDAVRAAHGVLFVSPEYNRSMTGALKNALDQGSRPYGKSVWSGKPAGVLGISPGAVGTALAQQQLRAVLAHLGAPTLMQPEMFLQMREGFFTEDGRIGAASQPHIQKFVDALVQWVLQHQG